MEPHWRALEATVTGLNVILRAPESHGQQDRVSQVPEKAVPVFWGGNEK